MSETGSSTHSVEIVQTVSRKRWTAAQKSSIVAECMQPGGSVARTARAHGISPAMLYRWRKLMMDGGETALQVNDAVVSATEVAQLEKKIAKLERILGKKTLENEILKAAVELARKKKLISLAPLSGIEGFE